MLKAGNDGHSERLETLLQVALPAPAELIFYGGDYNLVSPADLNGNKYVGSAHRRLTRAGFEQCRALPRDAVLVGCIGNVGKLGMVADEYTASNQQINAIVCSSEYDPHFIYYRLYKDRDRLEKAAVKTTVPILNKTNFESFEVDVPCLADQRKIAAVLGLVQRAIEQQERLIALTAELKKALLHKLFTEGLRGEPQKQTEIGPVPESWEVAELGKLVNLFGGYAFRSEDSVPISNTQLVRMGNLYQNKLDLTRSPIFYPDDFTQQYARFVLKQGDLIMSLTGTSGKEDYGFTVEIKHVPKTLLLNQRVARVDITCSKLVKDFLFYFLLSRKFLNQLYQTAKGMKQANLSTYAMKELKVPVPSVREQKNIADYFRAIDQRNDIHQRRVDMLQDLFRTLLHQLMMAQIRVHDLNLSELESDL